MRPGSRIVIAGPARSGTTALFYAIRGSLEGPVRELFEARRFEPAPGDEGRTVLAKVLIGRPGYADYATFDPFDTKLGLVRDPRDWLLSVALYSLYSEGRWIATIPRTRARLATRPSSSFSVATRRDPYRFGARQVLNHSG